MDHARRLVETGHGCAAPYSAFPPLTIHEFGTRAFVRCSHCGERYADGPSAERIRDCGDCGVPCLVTAEQRVRCSPCSTQENAAAQEISGITAAVEREWLTGLDRGWGFVSSEQAGRYLERLRHAIVGVAPGLPSTGCVVLVREPAIRSLSFPGGVVCLSTGLLGSLGDEAELVFLLARELAHCSSIAWSRHALRGLTKVGDRHERLNGWLVCAEDLMRLGHGDAQEFEADRLALQITRALGYDCAAPLSWLRRIDCLVLASDRHVAEFALAHPPVHARVSRIESELNLNCSAVGPSAVCNRAVFRRLLGHSALQSGLRAQPWIKSQRAAANGRASASRRAMAGLLMLAAAGLVWWLLTRFWIKLG